jgi:hypothetical protein
VRSRNIKVGEKNRRESRDRKVEIASDRKAEIEKPK